MDKTEASLLALIFLSLKKSLNLLEYLDGIDDDDVHGVDIVSDVSEADDDVAEDEALGDVGVVRGIDIVRDGDVQRELFKLMYALLPRTPPR